MHIKHIGIYVKHWIAITKKPVNVNLIQVLSSISKHHPIHFDLFRPLPSASNLFAKGILSRFTPHHSAECRRSCKSLSSSVQRLHLLCPIPCINQKIRLKLRFSFRFSGVCAIESGFEALESAKIHTNISNLSFINFTS